MKLGDIKLYEDLSFLKLEKHFNVYETKDGQYFLNLIKTFNVEPPEVFNAEVETYHTVTPTDNFYYISYLHYKTIDLWWFVCTYNKINNPTVRPEPGTKLRILKINYVAKVLNKYFNDGNGK